MENVLKAFAEYFEKRDLEMTNLADIQTQQLNQQSQTNRTLEEKLAECELKINELEKTLNSKIQEIESMHKKKKFIFF